MAVPTQPKQPIISELKSTSVKVSSGHAGSGLTSWFFYIVRTDGTGGKFVDATYVESGGDVFAAVITNLTPDDQYSVSAGVFNEDGQSPYSTATIFTTYLTYSPPAKPDPPSVYDITSSGATVWQPAQNLYGRPADLEYEVFVRPVGATAYGSQRYYPNSARVFGSLSRATQYVAYARIRNEVGWSDNSDYTYFTTLATVPDQPPTPLYANVAQNAVDINFSDPNDGGSAILERQIQWGTDGTTFPNLVASDGSTTVTNLAAGDTIYFRVRVRNAIGWSTYSPVRTVKLIAGAWVKWENTWREAVPWVKMNGVWYVAKPWVKIAGVWKGVK